MPGRVEMLGRVLVLRVIATADMPAGPAQAQMHPGIAHLQAFFAAVGVRPISLDEVQMGAAAGHGCSDQADGTQAALRLSTLTRKKARRYSASSVRVGDHWKARWILRVSLVSAFGSGK